MITGLFFHVGERFAKHFLVSKNIGPDKQLVSPNGFVVTRVESVQLFAKSLNNRLERIRTIWAIQDFFFEMRSTLLNKFDSTFFLRRIILV